VFYDVTTITIEHGRMAQALPRLGDHLGRNSLRGELLACWVAEIGTLNQVLVIRGYPDLAAVEADRTALTRTENPFGLGEYLVSAAMETCASFPFVEPMRPGRVADFFEVRTYVFKPDQLLVSMAAWKKALPERAKLSPLLAAMHSLSGPTPTLIHIWPYADLNERHRIRAKAVETKVWPPPGGPGRMLSQRNDIYVPAKFSPIH
jgi:NIPSNAP